FSLLILSIAYSVFFLPVYLYLSLRVLSLFFFINIFYGGVVLAIFAFFVTVHFHEFIAVDIFLFRFISLTDFACQFFTVFDLFSVFIDVCYCYSAFFCLFRFFFVDIFYGGIVLAVFAGLFTVYLYKFITVNFFLFRFIGVTDFSSKFLTVCNFFTVFIHIRCSYSAFFWLFRLVIFNFNCIHYCIIGIR